MRHTRRHAAVHIQLFEMLDLLVEAVTQCTNTLVLLRHLLLGDTEGLAHPHQLMRSQGAGAHAALVTTTVHLRLETNARLTTDIEGTDALRPVGLVRGKRHQVDLHLLQVDLHLAGGLGGIDMEQDAAHPGQLANGGDVVDGADLIVHVHHRHEDGVLAQRRLDHRRGDDAVFARLDVGHFEPFTLELASGIQNRLVLDLRGDDVLALGRVEVGDTLDRQVVRLGGTRGPDDLTRVGIDQLGHLATRIFHRFFRFPAKGMRARRRIAEIAFVGQAFDHLFGDTRVDRRGCGVVQVNRQFHSDISYQAVALLNRWRTFLSCLSAAKCRWPCACPGAARPAVRPDG